MKRKKLFAKEDVVRIAVFAVIYTLVSTLIRLIFGHFDEEDND